MIDILEDIADGGYELNTQTKSARITLLGEFGMSRTLEFPSKHTVKGSSMGGRGSTTEPPRPSTWIRK